jgi:hypothetical protein
MNGRRRKLWEIEATYHCSICGTCFSLDELQRIGQKAGAPAPAGAVDYAVHAHFVRCAARPGRVAKLMHKEMDRKFRVTVERTRRMRSSAELGQFWVEALERGDVAGPYWALLTHAATGYDLMARMFGEVHMLSHLQAGAQRNGLRRFHELEQQNQDLAAKLAGEKAAARRRLAIRDRKMQDLRQQLSPAGELKERLAAAEARLEARDAGSNRSALETRLKALEGAVLARSEDAKRAKDALAERTAELAAQRAETDTLLRLVRALEFECESLTAVVESGRNRLSCPFDLSGWRIVYVGGRTGLVAHFRALVEQANGRFIHHDGGLEDGEGRLGRLLSQGDVVLCPVDCVSHGACARAKRFCKQNAKMFIPLRSSGLSSFVGGLREFAARRLGDDGAIRPAEPQGTMN